MKRTTTLLLFLPVIIGTKVWAEPKCEVDGLAHFTKEIPQTDELTHIDANDAVVTKEEARFKGEVVAKRDDEVFYAESISYDRINEVVNSPSKITYGRPNFAFKADKASYSLKTTQGEFKNIEYLIGNRNANGSAQELKINRKNKVEDFKQATYTTCARENPSWFLKAKELHLDHNSDMGVAKHTTFHVADVPVLYLPYFSFPLTDARKTGFLFPSAKLSSDKGFEITTPFYLNIAPNQDATFYPRLMSRRGLLLGAEYRYLLPDLNGRFAGTYISKDKKTGDKRWSFNTQHVYQPNARLKITTDYQRVSDKDYVHDYRNTLDLSSDNYLKSHITADYLLSPNYRIQGKIQQYQVANKKYTKASRPYTILPSISGRGRWSLGDNFTLSSGTELTNFKKDDFVSGLRLNQELALSYLFRNSYAFVKPQAKYRLTYYALKDQSPNKDDHILRSLPTFSLDTGLYFDRQTSWLGYDNVSQSLEPRLYYLYTPYKDQSDIPDFDTSLINTSYSSMFLDNRFTGKDRIGDANQLTTALTSTYTDNDTGKELAHFAIGQIQYFKDRRVSLNNSIADASRSNVFASARVRASDRLSFTGFATHDTKTQHTIKSSLGATYKKSSDKALRLSHVYDEDDYKQVDFAGVWRLNDNWRSFWRWNYSLRYNKTSDAVAGVEFADCCWGVRLVARHHRNDLTPKGKPENSFYVEFILNGLGNVGNDTSEMLNSIIPSYNPISYEGK